MSENIVAKLMEHVLVNPETECWEWQRGKIKGYGVVSLPTGEVQDGAKVWDQYRVHRLMYQLKCGEIPEGLGVLHRCDNPSCCNPAHLFLGTPQDNSDDMVKKGRNKCGRSGDEHWSRRQANTQAGEKNPAARFTDEQIEELRRLYATGNFKQSELALRFGMSRATVCNILKGKARTAKGVDFKKEN